MARIDRVRELEARRAALAAQSDAFRETLRADFRDFRLGVLGVKRKLAVVSVVAPLLLVAVPFVNWLLRRKGDGSAWRRGVAVVSKWVLRRQLVPLFEQILGRRRSRPAPKSATPNAEAGVATPNGAGR